ncbi:uncharacterized protein LOC111631632 [Centruroides sculpturatus]|uniref:uncharacterized protein LOC111631632 n=1 Tax=Centruroides sculpturatus TaxID=218467 RepID=UPI000C6E21B3|nr:uncharacterized protein LOC111631632 [Centruroides sculpturatus]
MMFLEIGTGRCIFSLVAVICCFAVLWPKVFYPMMQDSFATLSGDDISMYPLPEDYLPTVMRETMGETRPEEYGYNKKNPRMFIHPFRWTTFTQPRSSTTFGFIMPFYSIAIGIFFIYTIMRLLHNRIPNNNNNMLPETQLTLDCIRNKTIHVPFQTVDILSKKISTKFPKNRTTQFLENYGKDKVKKALRTLIKEMTEGSDSSNQRYKVDVYRTSPDRDCCRLIYRRCHSQNYKIK